jgi:hypothetical protein
LSRILITLILKRERNIAEATIILIRIIRLIILLTKSPRNKGLTAARSPLLLSLQTFLILVCLSAFLIYRHGFFSRAIRDLTACALFILPISRKLLFLIPLLLSLGLLLGWEVLYIAPTAREPLYSMLRI